MTRIPAVLLAILLSSTSAFADGKNGGNKEDSAAAMSAQSCDGADFVVKAGQAFDGAVKSGSAAKFSAAAAQYLDMTTIAFGALGQFRKELPKDKEAEYLALANGFLGRFAIKNAGRFQTSGIKVVNCQGQASKLTVNAKLASGQKLIARLQKAQSSYRIVDINLESVWLVQQMRSAFVGTIRRDGFDALFRFLKS